MKRFQVTEYEITSDYIKDEEIKIALLSDLHNKEYGHLNKELIDAIDEIHPDFILCSGDMIIGKPGKDCDKTAEFLIRLASEYSIFYGHGNHEFRMKSDPKLYNNAYEIYMDKLKCAGIELLENTNRIISVGNTKFKIHGYDIPYKYYKKFNNYKLQVKDIEDALSVPEKNLFHILIAHNPVYGEIYAKWGADLTVSGHLHGGIIRLPLIGGIITPQAKLFPKYDGGNYLISGNRNLIVSRGLGGHTIDIRIFNKPELIYIKLKSAKPAG